MHLRRIELQGFKTFSRRTVIELPRGVTAVAGPNGSGKSNLADAIRWALGEQATRPLRVRRAEDVIFAGTATRSRTGMAEVQLVFDNSDAWLPTPYSEVVVGRRLFRSGESEYSLNGARVRLRDIVDLLSAGGVGSGSSIVSQGHVDATLSQRPEERRSFLEEVAGIGRFQARRDQAEQRLTATRRNLDRLRDLVAEIEPGLDTLHRQAEVAEQGRELESELQAARVALTSHRLAIVRDQTAEAEAREQTVAERMAELSATTAADLRGQAAEAELRAQTEETVLHERREEEMKALAEIRSLEAEQQRLHERLANLGTRAEDLAERAQALENRQAELTAQDEQDELATTELTERAAGRIERLAYLKEVLSSARAAQEAQYAHSREQFELQARVALLDDRSKRLDRERAALEQAQVEFRKAQQVVEQEASDAASAIATETQRATNAAKAEHAAEMESEQAHTDEQSLAADLAAADRARSEHAARLEALEGEWQALQALQDVNGYDESVEAALRERVPGVLGRVRESLPEAPLRNAHLLEAALPEALDDWLVKSADDIYTAAEAVQEMAGGSVLRPLNSPGAPTVSDELLAHPEVLGSLDAYVDARDDRLKRLLQRVAVVADLGSALRVRAAHADGALPAIAALTGIVVDTNGTVRVPASDMATDHVAARLEEIAKTIEHATRERSEAETKFRDVSKQLLEATSRTGATRELRAQRVSEHVDAREHLTAAVGTNERAVARSAAVIEQRADATRRLESLQEELGRITGERGDADRALRELPGERPTETEEPRDFAELEHEHSGATADQRSDEAKLSELRARHEARTTQLRPIEAEHEKVVGLVAAVEISQASTTLEASGIAARFADATGATDAARLAARDAELGFLETRLSAQRLQMQATQRTEEERRVADDLNAAQRETERLSERLSELQRVASEELGLDNLTPQRLSEPQGRVERRVADLRRDLAELGPLNPLAPETYREQQARVDDTHKQIADLEGAQENLQELASRLQQELHEQFVSTFTAINSHFARLFHEIFGGGSATMVLTSPDDVETTGIEFHVQLPGKRKQELAALSGGERALVSTALIMALLQVRESPFCVLDEVDAALDDTNVERFCQQLHRLANRSQMLVISHNPITVESAEAIYGVTMREEGVSELLSMSMDGVATNGMYGRNGSNGHSQSNGRNGSNGHSRSNGRNGSDVQSRTAEVISAT